MDGAWITNASEFYRDSVRDNKFIKYMNSSSDLDYHGSAPSEALIFKYRNGLRRQLLMLVNVNDTMFFYMLY